MKKVFLSVLIALVGSSSLLAQADTNVLGFKGGDMQLARLLVKETNYPNSEKANKEVHSSVLVMLKFKVSKKGSIDSIQVLNPWPTDELFVEAAREGLLRTNGMWSHRDISETITIPFVFILEERSTRTVRKPGSKYWMDLGDYYARVKTQGAAAYAGKTLIPVYITGYFAKPPVH